jgi:hypothetical protein
MPNNFGQNYNMNVNMNMNQPIQGFPQQQMGMIYGVMCSKYEYSICN